MKTNIEIEMTIEDIASVIDSLPKNIDASIVFKTSNIGTARLIRNIIMSADATTDEQLDAEEKAELQAYKDAHPEFAEISSN